MSINNHQVFGFQAKTNDTRQYLSLRVGTILEARYEENQTGDAPPDNETRYWHNKDINGNYRGPLFRVKLGETWDGKPATTYWMPQLQLRAGNDQDYWAYEVGEQVLVLCVSGDPMQSIIWGALSCDNFRPPLGHDDLSHDKRPWRETVHRRRYGDGMLVEYDRYLHRELNVYPDGTTHIRWLHDDRTDRSSRQKETNSDQVGGQPRHLDSLAYPDGAKIEYVWDEDNQTHSHTVLMPDGMKTERFYDAQNNIHRHAVTQADGSITQHVSGDGHVWKKRFTDGTEIKYNLDTGELSVRNTTGHTTVEVANGNLYAIANDDISISGNGDVTISAGMKLNLGGDVVITGNVLVNGTVTAEAFIQV